LTGGGSAFVFPTSRTPPPLSLFSPIPVVCDGVVLEDEEAAEGFELELESGVLVMLRHYQWIRKALR
jgi:hypothetical protein